jgi:hypothetical protein
VSKTRQVKLGTGQTGTPGPENGRTVSEAQNDSGEAERRTRQRTHTTDASVQPAPPPLDDEADEDLMTTDG